MIMLAPLLSGALYYSAFRFLSALGIGFITFTALNAVSGMVMSQLNQSMADLSGPAGQIAMMAGLGASTNILISAYTARLSVRFVSRLGIVR